MGFHGDMRVDAGDRLRCAVDLRPAGIGLAMDDLPLKVGQRDRVVVDEAERADAGGGELGDDRRAEAAGAHHQHPRALQPLLAGPADLGQHDVAGVAFQLGV
jgi:hypothetical protein